MTAQLLPFELTYFNLETTDNSKVLLKSKQVYCNSHLCEEMEYILLLDSLVKDRFGEIFLIQLKRKKILYIKPLLQYLGIENKSFLSYKNMTLFIVELYVCFHSTSIWPHRMRETYVTRMTMCTTFTHAFVPLLTRCEGRIVYCEEPPLTRSPAFLQLRQYKNITDYHLVRTVISTCEAQKMQESPFLLSHTGLFLCGLLWVGLLAQSRKIFGLCSNQKLFTMVTTLNVLTGSFILKN